MGEVKGLPSHNNKNGSGAGGKSISPEILPRFSKGDHVKKAGIKG
jgi:hypothetical protein